MMYCVPLKPLIHGMHSSLLRTYHGFNASPILKHAPRLAYVITELMTYHPYADIFRNADIILLCGLCMIGSSVAVDYGNFVTAGRTDVYRTRIALSDTED